ncbi:hypothetical protein [Bacteroides sp.]|uniref:hypothetical protein n=1 Tax=Bacteroides sp. TaxID=29523 RepID=UPI0025C654AA|nr:hypothetical protein [Bacteroides sp.]
MTCALQDAIIQPDYTKAVIKAALCTPRGMRMVWCVVEDEYDQNVFIRFFNPDTTKILTSRDEEGKRGCENVENIVSEIGDEKPMCHIFGIRDCDYTKYDSSYHCPKNVFRTDRRDIEMMMMETEPVKKDLDSWDLNFSQKIAECENPVRYLGYLRIYNDVNNIGCRFNKRIRIQLVWNQNTHSIDKNWETIQRDKFIAGCAALTPPRNVTETDINDFISQKQLKAESQYNICRGHDMIQLLQNAMIQTNVYNETTISNRISLSYSVADFKNTSLCKDIESWAQGENVTVM